MIYLVFIPSAIVVLSEVQAMLANPVRQLRREREQRKRERMPASVRYPRLLAILILASLPFWMLAYPSLAGTLSGPGGEGAIYGQGNTITVQGTGPVDQVYVIRSEGKPVIPGYGVVSPGDSVEVQVPDPATAEVAIAPSVIPIFWIISLASVHPAFPALAIGLLPGLLILAALSPLWLVRRRAHTKRQRRRLPFGTGAL